MGKFVSVVMRIKMMSKFTELANQIHGLDIANKYEDLTVSGEWLMSAVDALHEASELEAQLKEREWISVEDELPPIGVKCLFYRPLAKNSNDSQLAIKVAQDDRGSCWDSTVPKGSNPCNPSDGRCHVTHWMMIQPPKVKDDE